MSGCGLYYHVYSFALVEFFVFFLFFFCFCYLILHGDPLSQRLLFRGPMELPLSHPCTPNFLFLRYFHADFQVSHKLNTSVFDSISVRNWYFWSLQVFHKYSGIAFIRLWFNSNIALNRTKFEVPGQALYTRIEKSLVSLNGNRVNWNIFRGTYHY